MPRRASRISAVRTSFSLRDGVIRPRELARVVAERGMDAVGITDRGGLYGVVRVAQACALEGVRPVFGADLALWPHPGRAGWEVRRSGRGGISRTMGPGQRAGVAGGRRGAGDPPGAHAGRARDAVPHRLRPPPRQPARRPAPALDPRAGPARPPRRGRGHGAAGRRLAGRAAAQGRPPRRRRRARPRAGWTSSAATRCASGSPTTWREGDDAQARAWCALAERLDVPVVAHQQPRYADPGDAAIADIVAAVRQQVPLDVTQVARGSRRNTEGYLKTPEEMARVFAERPDALTEAALLADACRVDLGLGKLRVPDFVTVRPSRTSSCACAASTASASATPPPAASTGTCWSASSR